MVPALSKGISELVATIMMILIVTGVGFGVFLYSMGYYSGVTSAKDEANKLNINIIKENYIIADVTFNLSSSPVALNVTIFNYGPTNLEMSSLYLNGTQLAAFSASPARISPGEQGL